MSWSALSLSTPGSDASNLNHDLTVFSVTPWTHNIREGGGNHTWLSFPNAIDAVINKLQTQPAGAVFALAVAAANAGDLASQINTLVADLPLKQLLQWQRHAANLVTLESDKFDLVAPAAEVTAMAINAIPEVKSRMEKAISQQALTEAGDIASSDPLTNLTAFEADKVAHDAVVNTALPALAGGAGWRFYAEGDVNTALRTGNPGSEYTMTAILVFVGSAADLAYLTELMP